MTKKYILFTLAILIVAVVVSFFIGRATIKGKTIYVQGETIHDIVEVPAPEHSSIPSNPILPMKPDTIWEEGDSIPYKVVQKVDTAKLIQEYITKNEYKIPLFDNKENGKLGIGVTVQYNKIQGNVSYDYTPIEKQVIKEVVFIPHIDVSWNSFGYVGAGGGIYYHDLGVGTKFITNFKDKGFEVNGSIKF